MLKRIQQQLEHLTEDETVELLAELLTQLPELRLFEVLTATLKPAQKIELSLAWEDTADVEDDPT